MINSVAAVPHLLLVGFVWAVIAVRFVVLPRSLDNWRLTWALAFGGMALVLKDPTVGPLMTRVLGEVNLRTVVHVLVMLAVTALSGLHNAWRVNPSKRAVSFRYGLVLAFGAVMFGLAAPARAEGIPVEYVGNWQSVLYFALFAAPVSAGLFTVTAAYARSWRRTGASLAGRGTVFGVIAVLGLMFLDAATMLLSAVFQAVGSGEAVTAAKQSANTWVFVVLMTAAAAVCARAAYVQLRARPVDGVATVWSAVTSEVPDVVLRSGGVLSTRQSRLRMATETYDGLRELSGYAEPAEGAGGPAGLARQIMLALDRKHSGMTPVARGGFGLPACATADEWLAYLEESGRALALLIAEDPVDQPAG